MRTWASAMRARAQPARRPGQRAWTPLGALWLAALTLATLTFVAPASAAPACTQGLLGSKLECQFGEEGEGPGQFLKPEGVAVDNSSELALDSSRGDVYVSDRANNRMDKFSDDGEFLLAWGWGVANGEAKEQTCGPQGAGPMCHAGSAGGGAGQVDEPIGVAVDSAAASVADGDVFVEDASNHRVDKFTAAGRFLLAWGEGVANGEDEAQTCGPEATPATTTCQAGVVIEGVSEGPGEFERMAPHAIAVDSAGTVYVGNDGRVQEFSDTGSFERQVTLENVGFVEALAVNEAGDIFVMSGDGVREYEPCASSCVGKELLANLRDPSAEAGESSIALGSAGELFVDTQGRLSEFEAAGEGQLASFPSAAPQRGLAFGDQAGELYALTPVEVRVLPPPPPGPLIETQEATANPAGTATLHASFDAERHPEVSEEEVAYHFEYDTTPYPEGGPPHGTSTAVENTSKAPSFQAREGEAHLTGLLPAKLYHFRVVVTNEAGETTAGADQTFTTLPALEIGAESATEVSATTAQLDAQINPLGFRTEYRFEYGHTTAYENGSVPVPGASAGSGVVPVAVEVALTGLAPATEYHYRVVAHNECEPLADPGRQCVFKGSDHTFTTQGASTPGLIDGRAWELVSPPDKHGASLEMSTSESGLFQAAEDGDGISYFAEAPITTAPAGARSFAYTQLLSKRTGPGTWSTEEITTPQESVQGINSGSGLTEYKMFSNDLSTALVEPQGATPLSPPLSEAEAGHQERTPYLRQNIAGAAGEYLPLLTRADVLPGVKFGGRPIELRQGEQPPGGGGFEEGTHFVASTPDLSHVVLSAPLALTSGFKEGFTPEASATSLYEWSAGALELVSILPDERPAAEAGLSSQLGNHDDAVLGAISSAGTRVVFESSGANGEGKHLYLRDLALGKTGETVQLDVVQEGVVNPGTEDPTFLDASADGSRVFFLDTQRLTEGSTAQSGNTSSVDLYMCEIPVPTPGGNLECKLKDLSVPLHAGEHADVLGADLGVDQTGSYVYFVASGVLATGATEGSPNLYVHDTLSGETRLVATLSPEDQPDWLQPGEEEDEFTGITSRVSANGRYVAFMSQRSLTGYDNTDVDERPTRLEEEGGVSAGTHVQRPDEEVFLYHAPEPEDLSSEAGTLTCVSCDPTGARPHGVLDPPEAGERELALLVDRPGLWRGKWLAGSLPTWPRISTFSALYQPRNLSNEGRLFFDSADALVPQDSNGKEDVYEYEPQGAGAGGGSQSSGTGSCALSAGCVGLISSGTSNEESAFIDASGMGPGGSEGEDVFFMTSAKLVPQDTDSALDVYDAHVCSTIAPCPAGVTTVPPACTTAESCRAASAGGRESNQSIYGPPATATFSGPGNSSSPPAKPAVKPKAKPLTRPQKLAKALRTCRKKHGRTRTSCEKAARRNYGPVKKAKKSSTNRRPSQ
jgi:hypothetical protein